MFVVTATAFIKAGWEAQGQLFRQKKIIVHSRNKQKNSQAPTSHS